jgi:hypothetical protein
MRVLTNVGYLVVGLCWGITLGLITYDRSPFIYAVLSQYSPLSFLTGGIIALVILITIDSSPDPLYRVDPDLL